MQSLSKVPQVTVYFWIIKILTTATGEAASDYLVHRLNPYLAVGIGFGGFVIAMATQLKVRGYVPWVYWLAVLMVAVFGTMAADVLHIQFKVPYAVSTLFFALALVVVFAAWQRRERTLSIHSIVTLRRELFYWTAVLATFAMGTALGDLTAYSAKLGFLSSGIIFAAVFLVPAIAYRYFNANAVFTFWFAYIMTRPFGASFADWTGKTHAAGGLNWGDAPVAFVLLLAICGFVAYLSSSGIDRQKPTSAVT